MDLTRVRPLEIYFGLALKRGFSNKLAVLDPERKMLK